MLLYLVRHGQTELNASQVIQGTLDPPLSPIGKEQASSVGDRLRLVPFTKVISSPQKRAFETAKTILSQHPRGEKLLSNLQIDDRLRARRYGEAQGRQWNEVTHLLKEGEFGIESDQELATRLHSWLSDLIQEHTPITSPLDSPTLDKGASTPIGANNISTSLALSSLDAKLSNNNTKKHERRPLPRPGMTRVPSSAMTNFGNGVIVLVLAHQECLSGLINLLTTRTTTTDPISSMMRNSDIGSEKVISITSPVELDVPEYLEVNMEEPMTNTSITILRIWWDTNVDVKVKGRLEAWCDDDHLLQQ